MVLVVRLLITVLTVMVLVVSIEEIIEVVSPPGIREDSAFIMHGKGQAIKSGKCGDLIINVSEISHDVYVRSGHNLNLNLKLNYPLVLGDKISLDTIDGTKILVTIPEHSEVGSNLRIPSKGNIF
jgi:DnaJ-class molecular chaperone